MLELLTQVVRVDAHHRVLARIEVGAAAEHFHRDLELLRRTAAARTLDEELEQTRVRARAAERAAAHDARRLFSQDLRFYSHRIASSGDAWCSVFRDAQANPSLTVNKPLLSHGFLWRNHNLATPAAPRHGPRRRATGPPTGRGPAPETPPKT